MPSAAEHLHPGTKDETQKPSAVLLRIVKGGARNVHEGMAPLTMDRDSKWG